MSILAHSRGSTTREQMKNCFCRHHSPRNKSRRHHKHCRSCDHTVINFSNNTTDVRRPGEFEKNPLSSEQ
ncbi:hypothetical protein AGABI2DRAFT_194251 [Agaricus bisporus var. bisporus H97]|uniref:hypothetical protein n=1 Tax=Agaricus bisporus var. bisporus (strain H97 / ATCC MYA-4626 / FGSC 10389) TaxID=936046 RepID=UPI00029F5E27|nr:hypothetical protein AGABI2DRAFT_194251 [Agaricus bisporus var. bisporus H97]EKV45278.1 hypothetical protein AGABI2DRAFT_194251 [Agaricus bisporus var. bisporus H97]